MKTNSVSGPAEICLCKIPGKKQGVDSNQILRLKGDGNYTWVHLVDGSRYLLSITLKRMQQQLPQFLRLNKADLVNPNFVSSFNSPVLVKKQKNRSRQQINYRVALSDGEVLDWSRRRFKEFSRQ